MGGLPAAGGPPPLLLVAGVVVLVCWNMVMKLWPCNSELGRGAVEALFGLPQIMLFVSKNKCLVEIKGILQLNNRGFFRLYT